MTLQELKNCFQKNNTRQQENLKKWNTKKTIARRPHPFREPVAVTNEILDFIDEQYELNDELTANRIKRMLNSQFNIISVHLKSKFKKYGTP